MGSDSEERLTPPQGAKISAWKQYRILMHKNFLYTKRNKGMLFAQVFAPIFFVFLLFLLSTAIKQMSSSAPEVRKVTIPNGDVIRGLPQMRCIQPFAPCYTLAYAPSNLVLNVVLKSGLNVSDTIGFETTYELDEYLVAHPWSVQGAYVFINWEHGNWEYAIQYNKTSRTYVSELVTDYTAETVALPMSSLMDREIILYQQQTDNVIGSANFNYTFSTMQFPQALHLTDDFIIFMFPVFFLAAIMLFFVMMGRGLVIEKELKLKEGMKMMGLKEFPYWASWFSYYQNDFLSLFLAFFLFGISMISFAFLLASLMNRSQLTSTIGFVVWVLSASVFNVMNDSVYGNDKSQTVANIVSLYSPFVFSKGIFDLSLAAYLGQGRSFSQRGDTDLSKLMPLEKVYGFLILDSVIYTIIALYITLVFPGEFGVPKKWYFFVQPSFWVARASKHHTIEKTKYTPYPAYDDEDVKAEEQKVKSGNFPPNTSVVIQDLMKVYGSSGFGRKPFYAVKGINLTLQNNQLFCLLGPNGAGKTTTFNMLSGMFPASAGDVEIFGYSISQEMDQIRQIIGVCPQHDLLWEEMTAKEHLEFFCRFKGIPENVIAKETAHRLDMVGMSDVANIPTRAYSGGEKRRLSVALATVGDPKIIYLDEPTTGMDPVSQHQVWKVISEAKKGRVVILTTHSMEEADTLSDRIGIVSQGQLRCLGSNIHLKNKFGSGYKINMYYPSENSDEIIQGIKLFASSSFPTWQQYFQNATTDAHCFSLSVPYSESANVFHVLNLLEENEKALGLTEVSINLSSLEDVFIKIALESQKETSLTMDSVMHSTSELEELFKATKEEQRKQTPYLYQAYALMMKNGAFYKRSWTTLAVQFFVTAVFLLVMFAMAGKSQSKYTDNPHPVLRPAPAPFTSSTDMRFSIPFGPNLSGLGSCCNNSSSSGLFSYIDFSILSTSNSSYFTLGDIPTHNYTFLPYATSDEMFNMLYDTSGTGWIAAYSFLEFNLSANSFHIGLVKNVSELAAEGAVGLINLIDNALLRTTTSSNYSLVVRIKDFPTWEHTNSLPGYNVEGTWVLLGCSFFMVSILSLIVREKSERLRYLMIVAGMRMSVYWGVTFLIGLTAYFVLMAFWTVLGVITKIPLFTLIAGGPLIALFLVFAFNQVGFAFLMSTFFDVAASASLAGYIWILFFVILTQSIVPIIVDLGTDSTYYAMTILPHFGISTVTNSMKNYYYPTGEAMSTNDFAEDRMRFIYLILFLVGLFFFIIHQYIEQVYPAEYGIPKHPLFFLRFFRIKSRKVKPITMGIEPQDVKEERATAVEEYRSAQWSKPVAIPGISKTFKSNEGKKVAIENLALTMNSGECFGILGPNGGGKTTLVNVVSGLYPVTKGDAKILGNSVVSDLKEAQKHTGVCPQDSVFWPEMSAREHLNLFGRLRNLRGNALKAAVDLALKQTLLTDAADRPAGGYSGGMKRRLSLAIAVIGFPDVVLLDEPTTGVDPFSRRVVWEAIRAYKKHITAGLVTHNMEEADLLCDRIAVVNYGGKVACVGNPMALKTRYDVGHTLSILFQGPNTTNVTAFIESVVPQATAVNILPGSCVYTIPKNSIRLSTLFMHFQQNSADLGIVDWAILPASLEEVLLRSTGNHDQV